MQADGLFKKEHKLTLRDRALQQIRQAILSGGLKPGTRLIEQELSEKMGISRLPIREALTSLEREGLVTVEPYKGAFVRPFSKEEVEELYAMRSLLEVYALQLAMSGNKGALETQLRAIVGKMKNDAVTAHGSMVLLDFQFHEAICRLSQNATLYKLWNVLAVRIQMFLNLEFEKDSRQESFDSFIENHSRLCDLISSDNVFDALRWLNSHLESGKATLQTCLLHHVKAE